MVAINCFRHVYLVFFDKLIDKGVYFTSSIFRFRMRANGAILVFFAEWNMFGAKAKSDLYVTCIYPWLWIYGVLWLT